MARVTRKDLVRKVSNVPGVKSRLVSFMGLQDCRVIFSKSEEGLTPELIFADDDCFLQIDKTPENFKVIADAKFPGILRQFQRFEDSLGVIETRFMGIKCRSLWHFYMKPNKQIVLCPVFIFVNPELLKISNIKEVFQIAA